MPQSQARNPSLIAAIDLGSNSFHMVVAKAQNGEIRILERLGDKVQLAAGIDEERKLSEESMQRMEARIPELAGSAVKRAYLQALTTSGKVIEARNGQLIETTAEGTVRVIRSIAKPVAVTMGAKRVRARQA